MGIDLRPEYSRFSGQNGDWLATLLQSGDLPALQTLTSEQVGDVRAADGLEEGSDVVSSVESTAGGLVSQPYHDGDTYWELPHGYYLSLFVYRQDIYDELGLEVLTSFQALLDNTKAIDEADLDIRGYGLAGKRVGKTQDEFQVFLANMGAWELRRKDPNNYEVGVELRFRKNGMTTLPDYLDELSQYSPDPSGIGWAELLSE